MKKNNLWSFSCNKRYYLTHPWKWIKEFFANLSNIRHRTMYGFAYRDAWNFFYWWTSVGAEALRYLAAHGCGYPAYEPWDTPKKWRKYLEDLADKLDWCCASCDITEHEENEYKAERDAICKRRRKTGMKHDMLSIWYEPTEEEQEIIRKFWERENELTDIDTEKRGEILKEIGKVLPRLWD